MSKLKGAYLHDHSYDELRARDYKVLMANVEHNTNEAKQVLSKTDTPNPFAIAAVFNNIAYYGGGWYIDRATRDAWIKHIKAMVASYDWTVVWGPTWHYPAYSEESDACMFVAKQNGTDNYMSVMRGTNFASMSSWLSQDFDTGVMKSMQEIVPNAPANAMIARGTKTGTELVMNLTDDYTGITAKDFLLSLPTKPRGLTVTGHSLGGTIVPTYFAYLNYYLNNSVNGTSTLMMPVSFAGLTPGNTDFNNYFARQLGRMRFYRFVNSLDIAPFCWYSKHDVLTIYDNNVISGNGCGSVWGKPSPVIDILFYDLAGKYQEMPSKDLLPGHCSSPFDLWETLALYNHHVSTYLWLMAGNKQVQQLWEASQKQEAIAVDNY